MASGKRFLATALGLLLAFGLSGLVSANRSAQSGTVANTSGSAHALVVGINNYCPTASGGPDLSFAVNDARDAMRALIDAYGVQSGSYSDSSTSGTFGNIQLLLDGDATKAAVVSAISNLGSGSNDDVLLFFSGHGTIGMGDPDGDGEKKDNGFVANTAGDSCSSGDLDVLWDGELKDALAGISANRIIVLGDFSFPSGFNNDLRQLNNVLYLAGAKGEEFENSLIQNGVFTEKVINLGIRQCLADDPAQNPHATQDGKVTLEEAYDYANHVSIAGVQGAKPNIVDNVANDVHLRPSGNTGTCGG